MLGRSQRAIHRFIGDSFVNVARTFSKRQREKNWFEVPCKKDQQKNTHVINGNIQSFGKVDSCQVYHQQR